MTPRSSWFDEVRQSDPNVADVAPALGLTLRRSRFGPCPACGRDEPRHPPVTLRHGGKGWMCAACKEHGDVLALVAWVRTGTKKPRGTAAWDAVRAVLAAGGWCSDGCATTSWSPPPPRPPPPPPPFPDARELKELLRACRAVGDVPEVVDWCIQKFGPVPIGRIPARVLPDSHRWPRWWPYGRGPWRLVVPMVDASGEIRSMHARATADVDSGKTRWPAGCRAAGLLFADPDVARPMLRRKVDPARVVIVEGMTDYLALTIRMAGTAAVLGASSGGFSALADARLPLSCRVFVWTDPSPSGDRYADEVLAALPHHDVRRVDLRSLS